MKKELNPAVKNAIDGVAQAYSETEGKTKAGRFLRFLLRVIPVSTLISAIAHKNK